MLLKFQTNRSVVAAINNVSVVYIKKTNRSADIDPVGILRLGRFNSPKTHKMNKKCSKIS